VPACEHPARFAAALAEHAEIRSRAIAGIGTSRTSSPLPCSRTRPGAGGDRNVVDGEAGAFLDLRAGVQEDDDDRSVAAAAAGGGPLDCALLGAGGARPARRVELPGHA